MATAGTGWRDGGDCGDYPRLCWEDDVADVDGRLTGPCGNDWTAG